uniref:diphosphoinositol polyphosphate phosphohydrolase 1-like isoform X1 n=1 Tax=Myxine glutinosa TaxID=7769 RepID=UPI00358FE057
MKQKLNQTRTYDEDGYRRRAACVCLSGGRENEVLLVSSSQHPEHWIIPGGGMEPGEEPKVAAVREVYEEAGVQGTLGRLLGIFENQDRKHRTYVFVLIVTKVLPDWEDSTSVGRKRAWFSVDAATAALRRHKPVQARYLQHLQPSESLGHPGSLAAPPSTSSIK